jgi:ABC-type multidrug transport system ATPase subunit
MCGLVLQVLRGIAETGKLVVGSIHQPASKTFSLFTHTMLLAQGHLVYQGPTDAVGTEG